MKTRGSSDAEVKSFVKIDYALMGEDRMSIHVTILFRAGTEKHGHEVIVPAFASAYLYWTANSKALSFPPLARRTWNHPTNTFCMLQLIGASLFNLPLQVVVRDFVARFCRADLHHT